MVLYLVIQFGVFRCRNTKIHKNTKKSRLPKLFS
uniref:Uncharacterized protein n=1 Tax=Phage sp. ctHEp8 TaxID=2825790 RepID=A0A8S5TY29_9VIRU|nr:MAG TPA: hypothetical protein [Phage sp. ctHEp8]DAQ02106.1 MAG TPA: hypothetical protein [Bacteriophage sp.]